MFSRLCRGAIEMHFQQRVSWKNFDPFLVANRLDTAISHR